jgi:hypothetical protein
MTPDHEPPKSERAPMVKLDGAVIDPFEVVEDTEVPFTYSFSVVAAMYLATPDAAALVVAQS